MRNNNQLFYHILVFPGCREITRFFVIFALPFTLLVIFLMFPGIHFADYRGFIIFALRLFHILCYVVFPGKL